MCLNSGFISRNTQRLEIRDLGRSTLVNILTQQDYIFIFTANHDKLAFFLMQNNIEYIALKTHTSLQRSPFLLANREKGEEGAQLKYKF